MHTLKNKSIRTCLALAAAVGSLATYASITHAQAAQVEGLEKLRVLGSYPDTLSTYAALPADKAEIEQRVKLARVLARATNIDLRGQDLPKAPDDRVSFRTPQDASAVFELDGRANFLFNGGLARYRKDESTPGLPARSALLAHSQRHLKALGLPVDEKQLGRIKLGGLNMSVPDGRGGSVVYEKLRTVRLERKLDGLPVEGDSRVVLQLAGGGALAALVYQWPTLGEARKLAPSERQKPERLRSLAEKQIAEVTKAAARAQLKTAELVLYDDGRGVIEPAYHIVVERYFGRERGERPIPFDFYLPVAVASKALYPHLEKAERAPNDGRDTRPSRNGDDS